MDLWALFSTSFLVGLSGAAAPGPLTAMAVREAGRGGFWRGWSVTIGHAIPELILVAALAFGLGEWLGQNYVVGTLAVVGGGVLLWMGATTVRDARHVRLPGAGEVGEGSAGSAVWGGVGTTLSNPYWFLWWATVGSGYVALSQGGGWPAVAVFFVGHILADVGWLGFVSALVASGRGLLSDGVYRGVLTGLGVFLFGFGLYFLWVGWGFWKSALG